MCVLDHEAKALLGVIRVQRQVCATCFENSEQPHHHLDRPLHRDAHQHLRAYIELAQVPCKLVGPRVQFAVGQCHVPRDDGSGIRRSLDLASKHLVNGRIGDERSLCPVPLVKHHAPFGLAQERKV